MPFVPFPICSDASSQSNTSENSSPRQKPPPLPRRRFPWYPRRSVNSVPNCCTRAVCGGISSLFTAPSRAPEERCSPPVAPSVVWILPARCRHQRPDPERSPHLSFRPTFPPRWLEPCGNSGNPRDTARSVPRGEKVKASLVMRCEFVVSSLDEKTI